jgi:hypothetical protein
MIPANPDAPLYRSSAFPSGQALAEIRRSPQWRLFKGWRPSKTNRRAARIGEGTRRALALLRRLDAEQGR